MVSLGLVRQVAVGRSGLPVPHASLHSQSNPEATGAWSSEIRGEIASTWQANSLQYSTNSRASLFRRTEDDVEIGQSRVYPGDNG